MSKAGWFAARLKAALTPDVAEPPVPELRDVPGLPYRSLRRPSALPAAAAPPLPTKHPASRRPQRTHQLFPVGPILHRLRVRLSCFSANCSGEDQHGGVTPQRRRKAPKLSSRQLRTLWGLDALLPLTCLSRQKTCRFCLPYA